MSKYRRILLVDDELDICLSLSELLQADGHAVDYFTSPVSVEDFFKNNHKCIDLVITDYHIDSSVNGLDMIKRLHQIAEVPYLLMSGNLGAVTDVYCRNEIKRIEKPFDPDLFMRLLHSGF
jgi:DNA-binding NtrC family response regulator